jgi:hypothetical protein
MGTGLLRRQPWRLLSVVAAVSVLATGGFLLAGPVGRAGADPISSCSTTSGVVIVVDFSAFSGAINRQCDPDITSSTTAYSAMNTEGFATQGDSHDGDAFVCRINDLPSPAQDPCVNTPPTSAYWAFWIAGPGQTSWSVSPLGAMSLAPRPGSTELWAFGSGSTPSFPPSAVAATDPVVPTTAPPPVTTAPAPPGGTSSAGSAGGSPGTNGTGAGSGGSGKAAAATHTTAPAKSTVTTESPIGTGVTPRQATRSSAGHSSSPTLHIVDAAPASSDTNHTSGSPVALLIGGAVVLALVAGTLLVVRRRRRLE